MLAELSIMMMKCLPEDFAPCNRGASTAYNPQAMTSNWSNSSTFRRIHCSRLFTCRSSMLFFQRKVLATVWGLRLSFSR